MFTQAFTAFGPTLIQPTWFCSRELFEKVGPFSELGKVRKEIRRRVCVTKSALFREHQKI